MKLSQVLSRPMPLQDLRSRVPQPLGTLRTGFSYKPNGIPKLTAMTFYDNYARIIVYIKTRGRVPKLITLLVES